MKSFGKYTLILAVIMFACYDSEKNRDGNNNIINDPTNNNSSGKLQKFTIVDTIQKIYEYYWKDEYGLRQGLSYSLTMTNPPDTFLKFYYFNDTLLNYITAYSDNKVYKISVPTNFNNSVNTIQEYRCFDSIGNLIPSKSCYIKWNHDISKVIDTNQDTITITGEHMCHNKEFFESKAASYFNGKYSDTIYLKGGDMPDFQFGLRNGLNRIKIYHSSSSYIHTYNDTIWLDKEYIIFVNKQTK